jgi:hypothetical protein
MANNFYKTHHHSNLKKTIASFLVIYFVINNKGNIKITNLNSCDSYEELPKILNFAQL